MLYLLLQKHLSAWYNPSTPPGSLRLLQLANSEQPWAAEDEKGSVPVSQAGCEALGEAGSWVPAPWEIRLYEQNLGDFILQRRDRSLGGSGSVIASYLLLGGSHRLGARTASRICNQRKRNQNVKTNKLLP